MNLIKEKSENGAKMVNSGLWITYLCNRLASIEADIRTARTIRLSVIAVTAASFSVVVYVFRIMSFTVLFLICCFCTIIYLSHTVAFSKSDTVVKRYENLIVRIINGVLTDEGIDRECKQIKELEKDWKMVILKGRFWRIVYKKR